MSQVENSSFSNFVGRAFPPEAELASVENVGKLDGELYPYLKTLSDVGGHLELPLPKNKSVLRTSQELTQQVYEESDRMAKFAIAGIMSLAYRRLVEGDEFFSPANQGEDDALKFLTQPEFSAESAEQYIDSQTEVLDFLGSNNVGNERLTMSGALALSVLALDGKYFPGEDVRANAKQLLKKDPRASEIYRENDMFHVARPKAGQVVSRLEEPEVMREFQDEEEVKVEEKTLLEEVADEYLARHK